MYRKNSVRRLALWLLLQIASFSLFAQLWTLQPAGSSVTFKIKNAGLWVNGSFGGIIADIHFDPAQLSEARMVGTVQVKTIDTGIGLRNKHLRSDDYFNEARFPLIRFESYSVSRKENTFIAHGKLTIKDVSKEVSIPFTFEELGKTGKFKAEFTLNRRDYGVGGNSWTLGDEVVLTVVLTAQSVNMVTGH